MQLHLNCGKDHDMKKTIFVSILASLLVAASLAAMGCSDEKKPEETTSTTTTQTRYIPSSEIPDFAFQAGVDKLKEVEAAKASEKVEKEGYSGMSTDEAWYVNEGVDTSVYDFTGNPADLIEEVKDKYPKHSVSYYTYDAETKTRKRITDAKLKKMGNVLVFFNNIKKEKILQVYIQEMPLRIRTEFKSIEGGAGYFLICKFDTNTNATFEACIANTKGAMSGHVKHENIVPKKSANGYTGGAKMTIPYVDSGNYYLNIGIKGGECVASVPIKIEQSDFSKNEYKLLYAGDWDEIRDPNYQVTLSKLFYNTYARLYERFAIIGNEPKTITFGCDPTYDGVAYCQGTKVVVSLDYANANPTNFGFFSHEITHSTQQYNFAYGDGAWWTENMANYGGFRYYHWSDANSIQLYKDANQNDLYDWINSDKTGYDPYGDGSKWFFAYLDEHWPTTKNPDGSLKKGLIDTINMEIKIGRLNGGDDNPFNKNNTFNKIVKEVTGYDCMDDIRKKYAEEFKSGKWDFVGFGNYVDNFLTEGLEKYGVQDPDYPMISTPVHTDKTATALTGTNLVTDPEKNIMLDGATVLKDSGYINGSESSDKLIDGKYTTKWCATKASDKTYSLDGTQYWIIIDLGEVKDFDTYTLYNCKTQENHNNMSEWELFVSDDAKNWTAIDYQKGQNLNKVSYNVGDQSGRYLFLRIYNGGGTLRVYEMELYKVD